ncbi:hypothetical protein [Acinetobacter sp.]|uniref:hypothetical protein n=1 Tax=Acinetobacter sp. TaxID=472 RepID=UPI003C75AAEC
MAFLCFNHHDQYDSTTRQSKNFTKLEVFEFKRELYECLNEEFLKKYDFGNNKKDNPENSYLGCYIRDGEYESAEINIEPISENNIQVTGLALWGKTREFGPNLGELSFTGQVIDNKIFFQESGEENPYWIKLIFLQDTLMIEENAFTGYHGMNVTFKGTYHRVKQ